MRNALYILTATLLLTSCRSLNKMIERGDYESAINLAERRLQGDKKKSTKNIKYLEEAYQKLLTEDMRTVQYLKDK